MEQIKFEFDGGDIMLHWDEFEDTIEWFKRHMGWQYVFENINDRSKRAAFRMPGGGQANFACWEDGDHLSWNEGDCRLCFLMADLEQNLEYFVKNGIQYSKISKLPDGRETFDIIAYNNLRLTVNVHPEWNGKYPGSRILTFDSVPIRLGVRDIQRSVEWYSTRMGMSNEGLPLSSEHAILKGHWSTGEEAELLCLEKISPDTPLTKANPAARIYYYIRDADEFIGSYSRLASLGTEMSEIKGDPGFFASYYFYDLDGNRMNVWIFH